MMQSNSCAIRVGRLMEIRVGRGYNSAEDVDEMIRAIAGTLVKVPAGTRVVIAADWRNASLLSPAAAARAHVMLTGVNDRIERSAILASDRSPTAVLQFVRLVIEAEHPSRRVFYRADEF